VITTLKHGDTLNVIHAPRFSGQDWTEVQYIAGNQVFPTGVMRTRDLNNWTSNQPDVALSLLETFAPPYGASDSDLSVQAGKLSAFIQRFPGTPQQAQAQADLDKVNAALNHGAPAENPPKKGGNQPPVPAPASTISPEAALSRAQQLWENGQYVQAERLLRQALQQKPDFTAAKTLLERVQKARQLEGN
jgi:Tetratricopeptide repeat